MQSKVTSNGSNNSIKSNVIPSRLLFLFPIFGFEVLPSRKVAYCEEVVVPGE